MNGSPIKHLLVGTAGHVDHGKTRLIGALTGVDTDRLEEEHERGISIVLGFAEYLPSRDIGALVGVIDVPGHERFIKTMVAGATGVDVALFVVALDEGVKPQTREHLEILNLLGVRNGLIVLTKADLVDDEEWIELITEEVRDLVAPTFLADVPAVVVSAETGQGLDDLKAVLDELLESLPDRSLGGAFRMPIDRSFTVKGIGTVVTGSVWSGTVGTGEALELQPSGKGTRIREIQQHGVDVDTAVPGTRTALAIHGVTVEEAAPGSWLVAPKSLEPTRRLDLDIVCLESAPAPLEHNQRIRVHHGTQETFGRIRVLGTEEIKPGESGFLQLHLEEPVVAAVGDRMLIRRYSPMRTVAGARVLDVDPPRHRRHDEEAVEGLQVRSEGDPTEAVALMARSAGLNGIEIADVVNRSGLSANALRDMASGRGWIIREDVLLEEAAVAQAVDRVVAHLDEHHRGQPLRRGLTAEVLASFLGLKAGSPQAETVLEMGRAGNRIERDPPFWRSKGFRVELEGPLGVAVARLSSASAERGMLPWDQEEALAAARQALGSAGGSPDLAADLLQVLEDNGELIRYPGGFLIHREGHASILDGLRKHFTDSETLSVGEFRELSGGLSRKYVIPILEYYDARGYTRRQGDARLRGSEL
ncbi:selenocysteine-specific translation elongation factor [Gemmatimonadota bacterium]